MENDNLLDFDPVALKATQDRARIEELLANKPLALRKTIMNLIDQTPDVTETTPGNVHVLLGMDKTIRTKADLCRSLERAGLEFNSKEYYETYDKYCASHPELTLNQ